MTATNNPSADYDKPGKYNQNAINGFDNRLIDTMFERSHIANASKVMDAMSGDGNLSISLFQYCKKNNLNFPDVLLYELSEVQASIAKESLKNYPAKVVQGNILELNKHSEVPKASFDRVLIKSASHEISNDQQTYLYQNIIDTLKPGGAFVNLGMLFEDTEERDESRSLAKTKDSLAGMHQAAQNRHFLTRKEIDQHLKNAGFNHIQHMESFDYKINSSIVAKYYFKSQHDVTLYENKASECKLLQARHRILMEEGGHTFFIPGRITIALRPSFIEENLKTFRLYPMDFLRKLHVHRELLHCASNFIVQGNNVLELGCGIGLFAEHLSTRKISYEGIDIQSDFITACRDRFYNSDYFRFYEKDINELSISECEYDHVCLLNTLNCPGIEPISLLKKSLDSLKKGGTIIISGPTSRESFQYVEPFILEQLLQEGLSENHPDFQKLREANSKILTEQGNYWSAEGLAALLTHIGFDEIVHVNTQLYHGFSYLIVARK